MSEPRSRVKKTGTSLVVQQLRICLPMQRSEVKSLSRVQLFVTPWTVAYQAPLSMEFSRQEYWSGLPFPSPGDLPDPGIEPRSPALQADALLSEPPGKPHLTILLLTKLHPLFICHQFHLKPHPGHYTAFSHHACLASSNLVP